MSLDRYKIEKEEDWRGWIDKIPFLQFKEGWKVKVIPPFSGAMARFIVEHNGKSVSVYLDCDNSLGYFSKQVGEPYWEVCPSNWVAMNDTIGLMAFIEAALNES